MCHVTVVAIAYMWLGGRKCIIFYAYFMISFPLVRHHDMTQTHVELLMLTEKMAMINAGTLSHIKSRLLHKVSSRFVKFANNDVE